jgi:hypothetical protein
MLFALGAASSALGALQSLLPSKSSTPSTATPFALSGSSPASGSSAAASGASGYSQLSPATMNALFVAQSQPSTGSTSQTSTSPAGTLQSLSSQFDGDDDGEATTSPTYGDGSTTSPQAMAFSAATSSYNFMGQMAQRQPLSFSA